jgi:hypothetical protein
MKFAVKRDPQTFSTFHYSLFTVIYGPAALLPALVKEGGSKRLSSCPRRSGEIGSRRILESPLHVEAVFFDWISGSLPGTHE